MKLPLQVLKEIALRAASMEARYGKALALGETPADMPLGHLVNWTQSLSDGEGAGLPKRLEWAKANHEALQEAADQLNFAGPENQFWVQWLKEVLLSIPDKPEITFPEQFSFENLLKPFVNRFQQDLEKSESHGRIIAPYDPEIKQSLRDALIRELITICGPAFQKWYESYRNIDYSTFVRKMLQGDLIDFFRVYSVLARNIYDTCQGWKEAFFNLLAAGAGIRIPSRESPELFHHPQKILSVQFHTSARENRVLPPALLRFEHDLWLYFKPRSSWGERIIAGLLQKFSRQFEGKDYPSYPTCERASLHWVASIPYLPIKNKDQAKRFFRRTGWIAAVNWLLAGRDLHYGNVIAYGEYPIVIDAESLFSPGGEKLTGIPLLDKALAHSPGTGGYLFNRMNDLFPFIGGLEGIFASGETFEQTEFIAQNDQFPAPIEKSIRISGKNLPEREGKKLEAAQYLPEIISGWEEVLSFAGSHSEKIRNWIREITQDQEIPVRLLLKPTHHYAKKIEQLSQAPLQKTGLARSIFLESSFPFMHRLNPGEQGRNHFHTGKKALDAHCFPRFLHPSGQPLYPAFPFSGENIFQRNLDWLSQGPDSTRLLNTLHKRVQWGSNEYWKDPRKFCLQTGEFLAEFLLNHLEWGKELYPDHTPNWQELSFESGWTGLAVLMAGYFRAEAKNIYQKTLDAVLQLILTNFNRLALPTNEAETQYRDGIVFAFRTLINMDSGAQGKGELPVSGIRQILAGLNGSQPDQSLFLNASAKSTGLAPNQKQISDYELDGFAGGVAGLLIHLDQSNAGHHLDKWHEEFVRNRYFRTGKHALDLSFLHGIPGILWVYLDLLYPGILPRISVKSQE